MNGMAWNLDRIYIVSLLSRLPFGDENLLNHYLEQTNWFHC